MVLMQVDARLDRPDFGFDHPSDNGLLCDVIFVVLVSVVIRRGRVHRVCPHLTAPCQVSPKKNAMPTQLRREVIAPAPKPFPSLSPVQGIDVEASRAELINQARSSGEMAASAISPAACARSIFLMILKIENLILRTRTSCPGKAGFAANVRETLSFRGVRWPQRGAWLRRLLFCAMMGKGILAAASPSPYTPDVNTLVLVHFDETSGGSVFTNLGSGGGNAYSVNMTSASSTPPVVTTVSGAAAYAGFGNAANLNTSGYLIGFDANSNGTYEGETTEAIPMSLLNMGNGGQTPWTIEAMIYPSVINVNQEIISTDSSAGNRGFQFRLNNAGQLELNLISISADIKTAIPTTAADPVNGFVANNWYHVAAAYDGVNIVLYWTKVTASFAAANPISTNAVAVGTSFGTVQGPLVIGNENRGASGENFKGLIDEVRISNIARAANQVLLASGPVSASPTVISPANPVYAGTPATLSATVFGQQPISYLWQSDEGTGGVTWTGLSNSTTNSYTINTAAMQAGTYQYRLVVTNSAGSATNLAATMNVVAGSGPILVTNTTISRSVAYVGNSVGLSAAFTGTGPLTYQWFFTANGGGTVPVAGATNSSYTLVSVQTNNAGSYFVTAANNPPGLGSRTLSSAPATLTVLSASSGAGMFCELLTHPEETVISAPTPRFGWSYQPSFRGDLQTGYQIIVASSPALALSYTGDVWDSGLVGNSSSLNVPYGGPPLQANTSYFWRVRTQDSAGQLGAFFPVQQFNTAAQLYNPLTNAGVIYQLPQNNSVNCYPLRFVNAGPVLVTNTGAGNWFIDFGQDAFGYAAVHLNGNFSGTTVQARFGEMANGTAVNTAPAGSVRYGASTFSLQNGDVTYPIRPPSNSGQTISPPAAYGVVLPFRYLELINFPGTLTASDVTQYRLVSEFDTNAAAFTSSSSELNQVWNLCRNSMHWLTFNGIYVDGDRERKPYEADAYIQQLSAYAVNNDFTMPRCSFEYLATHPTWPTEWKFHMIFLAWADYLQTGNADLLNKYYSTLQYDSFTWAATGNGLMQGFPGFPQSANSDIVDWPAGDRDGFTGIAGSGYRNWTNSVNNAFYYRGLRTMANIASVIGRTNDAAAYNANADQVYSVYNSTFWDAAAQRYVDGVGTSHASVHANFFPLDFGLVPASNRVAVVNYLHSRIAANNGMPPSVYGAQYLLEGLFQADDTDTALGLMTTNGPRSWMNMINLGSTLTDEAWSFADKSNEDWNHAWGAAAGNLTARYVLGLQPLVAGFGQILIQPRLGSTLSFVQGVIPTIRGPVFIQVTNGANAYQLLINVPGNVTATVMLPATNTTTAIVDGAVVSGTLSNNWLTVNNIGSGQHAIWLNGTGAPATTTLYNNWASAWFGTNAGNSAIAGQTADPDGDGLNNYSEFIAGTDPTNPDSLFAISASAQSPGNPSNLVLTVSGQSGRSYILQRTLSLSAPLWSSVVTNGTLNASQTLYLSDPQPPPAQAFYRVLVSMP
jgi:alpha-L-rhamnosidase